MAGGIEQIDDALAVGELHHRRSHRNAALLLQFHPVRNRVAVRFARAHRARHLDRAAEPQHFLGEGGFTRVGVGNDGESAAAEDFFVEGGHNRLSAEKSAEL